jgi:hypothetical protein
MSNLGRPMTPWTRTIALVMITGAGLFMPAARAAVTQGVEAVAVAANYVPANTVVAAHSHRTLIRQRRLYYPPLAKQA